MRSRFLHAMILITVIIFAAIGCAGPASTPTATTTPTQTPISTTQISSSDVAALEARIKNLESKVEQLSIEIAEINPYSDEPLIPTVPFKITMKRSAGHAEFAYEIGMDPAMNYVKSSKLSDSGLLKTGVRWGIPYTIYRENNTIAIPPEYYEYYSLRLCDKKRVAMMYHGFPDIVREYEIQLAEWNPTEGVYKWPTPPTPTPTLTQAEINSATPVTGKVLFDNGVQIGVKSETAKMVYDPGGLNYIEIETEVTVTGMLPGVPITQGVVLPTYGEIAFKTAANEYLNATFEPAKTYEKLSYPKIRIYSKDFDSQKGKLVIKYLNKTVAWDI